jgi:hypothetical protein
MTNDTPEITCVICGPIDDDAPELVVTSKSGVVICEDCIIGVVGALAHAREEAWGLDCPECAELTLALKAVGAAYGTDDLIDMLCEGSA